MTDQPKRSRAIRLGSGRRLTLRDYIALWRRVKSAADTGGGRCAATSNIHSIIGAFWPRLPFSNNSGVACMTGSTVGAVACHGGANAIQTGSVRPFRRRLSSMATLVGRTTRLNGAGYRANCAERSRTGRGIMTDRPFVQIVNVSVVSQFENADVALHQSAVSASLPFERTAEGRGGWQ